MYKIIGGDGQPYGPATAEQVIEWIAAGRANAQTQAQAEGTGEWKPLSQFVEFANALGAEPAPSRAALPEARSDPEGMARDILARDYRIDIGACFTRAWELMKRVFWPILGVGALILILLTVSGSAWIGIILLGPFLGGLNWYYLRLIRGERAEVGDAFAGFSVGFVQLMLAGLVSTVLVSIGFALCLLPGLYLTVAWLLAYPLVMDKKLGFWEAMELSRKVVSRHWWSFCGLFLLSVLLNLLGLLLCGLGIFITWPVTLLAVLYAYEDVFGAVPPQET